MDFDDFLQDQPLDQDGEQHNEEGFFEEMPDDLFSDLSIHVYKFISHNRFNSYNVDRRKQKQKRFCDIFSRLSEKPV